MTADELTITAADLSVSAVSSCVKSQENFSVDLSRQQSVQSKDQKQDNRPLCGLIFGLLPIPFDHCSLLFATPQSASAPYTPRIGLGDLSYLRYLVNLARAGGDFMTLRPCLKLIYYIEQKKRHSWYVRSWIRDPGAVHGCSELC